MKSEGEKQTAGMKALENEQHMKDGGVVGLQEARTSALTSKDQYFVRSVECPDPGQLVGCRWR